MKLRTLGVVSAAALSLSLLAAIPASAQSAQLEADVAAQLTELGFNTDEMMVTDEQVLEIENVLNSDDEDDIKRQRVEEIVGHME
jgi:hypothetical protein